MSTATAQLDLKEIWAPCPEGSVVRRDGLGRTEAREEEEDEQAARACEEHVRERDVERDRERERDANKKRKVGSQDLRDGKVQSQKLKKS
jgi:hypothetical protein